MARIAIAIVVAAVWIYAIIDCARTDRSAMPGKLAKAAWLALTVFLPILGSLIWLYFSFKIKHPSGLGNAFVAFPGARGPQPKEKAPDDDPEFLARLDAELRFQEWERRQREHDMNKNDDESE